MVTTVANADTDAWVFNEKQEVAQLLARRAFLPHFSRRLEARFRAYYFHRNCRRMRITLALGLVMYLLAGLVDLRLSPIVREALWMVRYAGTAPFIAAALVVALKATGDITMQVMYAVATLAAGAGAIVSLSLYPQFATSSYTFGLLIILFYIYVISGMRIGYALPCGLIVTGVYMAGVFMRDPISDAAVRMMVVQLIVSNLVGAYAGYRLEKETRRSFLDGRMVSLLNSEMIDLVGIDELTGLANRRRMDEFYANTWNRALRDKTELTLLFIDVDFMQLLNDHLGRHIGDICLRKIGAVMQLYRQRPGDLAARYEGGKFLLILYGCNERHGKVIGERLRQDVEGLNLMNPASPVGWTVTVSVGVHAVVPTRALSPASALMEADTLLYMAKKRGHNRVLGDRDVGTGKIPAPRMEQSQAEKTLVLPRLNIIK